MKKLEVWSQGATRLLVSALLAAMLSACGGGGGNAGTPVVGPGSGASAPTGGTAAVAADLVVVLSKTTLDSTAKETLTASVTSVDANRAAVGGVPVSFTVDAKAVVTPAGTTTNATTGVLTATIGQGDDSTPRAVTLTVTSGSISRTVTFNVVQTSSPTNPQASDLTLTLSAFSIDNSGSKTVTATATAVDSNRNALQGIPVQLSVNDPSAFIVTSATQTSASGQVSGTVGIGQDRSNRTVSVVATSGSLVRTVAFQVTGARFSQASPVPSVVPAGTAGKIQYKVADVNSNPMPDVAITVSGAGVTSRSGKTDLNGDFTFDYVAPNAPGTNLTIKATAGGAETDVTVPIPGTSGTAVPVAATPAAKTLNLSADVVSVNSESSRNQVSIGAFFRDANNSPIQNVRVLFGVTGDNGTGAIGAGTFAVLSDASGAASTTYTPGAVSSPTNGVTIKACWKTSDFTGAETVANCPSAQLLTTTLTIVSNPVSISIGTDNTTGDGAGGLTYVKKFVVLVVDSAGNPKPDVQITPSLDLGGYGKGYYGWDTGLRRWVRSGLVGALTAICPNEDLNRNGVIDGANEDVNNNRQLDPRKSDVAIAVVGSTRTDATGVAVLQLEYPKSLGSWVKFKITVTAAGVLSPPAYFPLGAPVALPSQAQSTLASVEDYLATYDWLPVSSTALTTETPPPAFVISPYGQSTSCIDTR